MIMRQAFLLAFAGLCVSVFGGTNSTSGNNGNGNGNGGNSGNGNGSSNAGGNGNGNSNGKAGGNGNGNSARNSTGNGNSKKVLAVGEACNPADKLCHAPAKCEPLPSVPSNGICAEGVSIPDKYTCTWNVNTTIPWGDEQLAWCCVNHGVRCPGPEAIDLSKTKEECLATAATADRSACCDSSGVLCESKCYSNTTALNTGQAMQCCRQHGLYCSVNCAGAAQLTGNEKHYCCAVNGLYCSEDQAFEQAEAALREAFDKSKAGKAQGTFLLKVKGQAQEVLANPRQLMLRARLALILASPQLHGDPSRLLMTRVGVLLANGEVPSLNKTGWSVETPVTWQTGDVFDNEKKVAAMQRGNKPGSGAKLDMSVNAAKPDSGAKPGKSAAKPDSGAKPDKSAAKPDSGAKPGKSAAKPDSGAKPDKSAAKPDSGAKPDKSAAKPDSGAKPDKSAAKPDSGAKPDKSAAKPDSGAKPDKSAAKPDSGARTDKSADKSDSGAKSDDKDDTSEEKDSSRFFEVLASDAIEGLFIEYAVYVCTPHPPEHCELPPLTPGFNERWSEGHSNHD